jgi:hypothetical protein
MMMFGLAITSAMVVVFLSNITVNGLGASAQSALLTGVSSGMAWTAFLSLFLGWLAAMGGASMWKEQKSMTLKHAVSVPPAA